MEQRTSTMSSSSSSSPPLSEEEEAEFIKVYLRLRPKNKLETMKRGKDCIELHDDPRMITCDSPKLGEIKFNFNHVFDEQTTQEEIYRECVSNIPTKLLEGYNSTVLAYGQKGSGKTHTLIGEGLGVELTALVSPSYSNDDDDNDHHESMIIEQDPNNVSSRLQRKYLDPKRHPNKTAGMIPRVVAHLFDLLYGSTSNDSSIEFSIRCSYVEIYLDKMTDLLQPNRRSEDNSGLRVGRTSFCCGTTNEACILGATELCCICPEDVYTILSRGQALRTASIDSSRSHTIFTLHLEQIDKCSGALSRSRLQILDIAGNQCRPIPRLKDNAPASIVEKRMINASLASFHRLVQLTIQQQKHKSLKSSSSEPISSSSMSKLAKILQPAIGGNTHTVMICTGSPSSYSIDDTIETIRFAQQIQKVYNTPRVAFESYTQEAYRMEIFLAARRQQQMTCLIRLLAQECKHGKKKSREPKNPKVWEAVLQIVEDDTQTNSTDDNMHISLFEEGEKEKEIRDLRTKLADAESKLQQEQIAREKIESAFRDTRSEIVSLKSQVESFTVYKQTIDQKLSDAKAKISKISSQKTEVDYLLRTSQFRENEAILFLRQLRTFYFRLLKNKAAHGSGGTRDVIEEAKTKMPGVADLEDLLDIDRMLIKSGIIENSEIGGDTPISDYSPSENALAKSALEARKVEERAWINSEIEEEPQDQYTGSGSTGLARGQLISYRQKRFTSPAGVLAIQKEKDLENDLLQLSMKCVGLQNSLNAEKSMVQALAGRQGAMTKMKQIQATITLKTELERKTNDLLAIVWKMNELHLVNKTIDAKAVIREQKCTYLSEYLLQLQTKNKRLVSQIEDDKKRLRDDNSYLRKQLEGMSLSLWQLGEHLEKAPIWRYSVPVSFSGDSMDFDDETNLDRRLSDGNLTEEEINGLIETVRCSD